MRQCTTCKKEFPATNEFFGKDKKGRDGFHSLCKSCHKASRDRSNLKHKDKRLAYTKSPNFVFSNLKYHAKKRNILFELTLDYYIKNLAFQPCFYCGNANTKHWVDRFDNSHAIGYTEKNSVPCCEKCNKSKIERSPEDFLNICDAVVKFQKKTDYINRFRAAGKLPWSIKKPYGPERALSQLRYYAVTNHINWSLSRDDFLKIVLDKPCPFCGNEETDWCVSRKSENDGYNINNVDVCCPACLVKRGR